MNTMLLLLATSSVPAADAYAPAPAAPYTYSGGQAAAPATGRPRFFGRLRGMFSRKSQNAAPSAPYGNPTYAAPAVSGNQNYLAPGQPAAQVWTAPPAVPGRLVARPAPAPVPVLTNEPPLAPPVSAPARQMPVGEPKFE